MLVTISWTRAYHTRRNERSDVVVEKLARAGLVRPVPDADQAFFDIQSLRSSHFATAIGPDLVLEHPGISEPMRIRSHVMVHASGFLVLRYTASGLDNPILNSADPSLLADLERLPWTADPLGWSFQGHAFQGNLRAALNALFIVVHEVLLAGSTDPAAAVARSQDGPHGNDYLHQLCARGQLSHPFPVSFGTHVEFWEPDLADDLERCKQIVDSVLELNAVAMNPAELAMVDSPRVPWFVFENQSFVFCRREPEPFEGVLDIDLALLVSYATLRRGALRSIQRDTQRVLSGGRGVSRRRIDEWRLMVTTVTDGYVLHDRMSQSLVALAKHLRAATTTRNPELLEQQVRQNIDSFQARIELAEQSVSTLVGALFAVVAAVLGLGSILKVVAASWLDLPLSALSDQHPWINSGIDMSVTLIAFGLTWLVIRRVGSRVPALRPYSRLARRRD